MLSPNSREQKKIGAWLVSDHTGCSSLAMCAVFLGADIQNPDYPYDPADFHRCVRFLRECVDKSKWDVLIFEMGTRSPYWKIFWENWLTMMVIYKKEMPKGNAPTLYKLILELRTEVEATSQSKQQPPLRPTQGMTKGSL